MRIKSMAMSLFSMGIKKIARVDNRQDHIGAILDDLIEGYDFEVYPIIILSSTVNDEEGSYPFKDSVLLDQFVFEAGMPVDIDLAIERLGQFRVVSADAIAKSCRKKMFPGPSGMFLAYEIFSYEGKEIVLEALVSSAGLSRKKRAEFREELIESLLEIYTLWFEST